MWNQEKPKRNNVIIYATFEDFANIEVEKRIKGSLAHYEILIHVEDICDESIDLFSLDEVTKALSFVKEKIEKLYDDIPLMEDEDLEKWIEEFEEEIEEY
jgi:hypothetical protein